METNTLKQSRRNLNLISLNSYYGGDYSGRDYDDSGYWLPDLIVTPDGSWWEDPYGNRMPDDEIDDPNDSDYQGGGLGGDNSMSDAELDNWGRLAYQHVIDSVNNQTAKTYLISESNLYKTLNTASLITECPGWQHNLVKALTNENLWGKLGARFCSALSLGGAIITGFGIVEKVANGENLNVWDYMQGAGAILGITSLCFTAGTIPLIIGSTGYLITLVGTAGEGYTNNSNY